MEEDEEEGVVEEEEIVVKGLKAASVVEIETSSMISLVFSVFPLNIDGEEAIEEEVEDEGSDDNDEEDEKEDDAAAEKCNVADETLEMI